MKRTINSPVKLPRHLCIRGRDCTESQMGGEKNAIVHINRSTQGGFLLYYNKEKNRRFEELRPLQMVMRSQFC